MEKQYQASQTCVKHFGCITPWHTLNLFFLFFSSSFLLSLLLHCSSRQHYCRLLSKPFVTSCPPSFHNSAWPNPKSSILPRSIEVYRVIRLHNLFVPTIPLIVRKAYCTGFVLVVPQQHCLRLLSKAIVTACPPSLHVYCSLPHLFLSLLAGCSWYLPVLTYTNTRYTVEH